MADKKFSSEADALREISSWKLGIMGSAPEALFKVLFIPRKISIGIKRWGMIDYLKQFGWKILRIEE